MAFAAQSGAIICIVYVFVFVLLACMLVRVHHLNWHFTIFKVIYDCFVARASQFCGIVSNCLIIHFCHLNSNLKVPSPYKGALQLFHGQDSNCFKRGVIVSN
eukprot:gnl/MRDRNA2_/MRDRNA2_83758_c0_seq1.p1 gnl/MRDRNA2_/MRDRNA2_83758_c0~~gnl/MRDRNA2_/MRDRNA2_83758_c0_seq1.p1  ORF type:complete len:102 (+),score=1.90 gnl/MRDRNA2_/MRDRNA2_83758_c0_seq1:96-401(+)